VPESCFWRKLNYNSKNYWMFCPRSRRESKITWRKNVTYPYKADHPAIHGPSVWNWWEMFQQPWDVILRFMYRNAFVRLICRSLTSLFTFWKTNALKSLEACPSKLEGSEVTMKNLSCYLIEDHINLSNSNAEFMLSFALLEILV